MDIKYRPSEFKNIVGNEETIEVLKSFIVNNSLPHNLLFFGPSGCGKTTLARIVKNELQCSDFDFRELNMSNNRGIDTAREIINTAHLKPLNGNLKIYLLDEVHKSTNEFQNALLKILEEPPEHVYFILCTTEKNKLLKTILTRCSTFEISRLNAIEIKKIVKEIAEKEKIKIEPSVIKEIIKNADGSARTAIKLFEKIISINDIDKQLKIVNNVKEKENQIIDLCRALLQGKNWSVTSKILLGIQEEPENVRRAVLGYFTKVILNEKSDFIKCAIILESFETNYYDSGRAGLILSCFRATN